MILNKGKNQHSWHDDLWKKMCMYKTNETTMELYRDRDTDKWFVAVEQLCVFNFFKTGIDQPEGFCEESVEVSS